MEEMIKAAEENNELPESVIQFNDSTQSSRELGFNAVERCRYCGKPSTHEGGICDNCYDKRY